MERDTYPSNVLFSKYRNVKKLSGNKYVSTFLCPLLPDLSSVHHSNPFLKNTNFHSAHRYCYLWSFFPYHCSLPFLQIHSNAISLHGFHWDTRVHWGGVRGDHDDACNLFIVLQLAWCWTMFRLILIMMIRYYLKWKSGDNLGFEKQIDCIFKIKKQRSSIPIRLTTAVARSSYTHSVHTLDWQLRKRRGRWTIW